MTFHPELKITLLIVIWGFIYPESEYNTIGIGNNSAKYQKPDNFFPKKVQFDKFPLPKVKYMYIFLSAREK